MWTLSLKPTYTGYVHELCAGYERLHPGWDVEWLDMPERVIMQKLLASTAGGDAPDLVNLGPNEAMQLAQNHALVPLDDLVSAADRGRYFPQFFEAIKAHGHTWSIPWYVSIKLLMYNTRLFRAAGLDPSRPPGSRSEIETCARALRKTGCYGMLPTLRILDDWQKDGLPILDPSGLRAAFATRAHAERIDWYRRLLQDDIIPPETLTGDYQEAVRRYKTGTLGMLISGPQFLLGIRTDAPDIYADTGVAPLAPGDAGVVPAEVMHFVVPRASRHHTEAAQLALHLTNDANQLELCKLVPVLPSTKQAARDPLFIRGRGQHPLEDTAMRLDAQQLSHARDLTLALPNMGKLRLALNEAVEGAIRGRGQTLPLLAEAAQRWDDLLAEAAAQQARQPTVSSP